MQYVDSSDVHKRQTIHMSINTAMEDTGREVKNSNMGSLLVKLIKEEIYGFSLYCAMDTFFVPTQSMYQQVLNFM